MEELPLVRVIGVGGTIAMKYDPATHGYTPALSEEDLLALVPGLNGLARVESTQFTNIPSDWITPEIWLELSAAVNHELKRPEVAGVVITHGTDTLEETAYFLWLTVLSNKPVVITGAQRTVSEPDFDGPRNLGDSIRVAVDAASEGRGVMVVFDGKIFAPDTVYKCHTNRLDAFSGGEYGAVGDVFQKSVRYLRELSEQRVCFDMSGHVSLPRVEVFHLYPGADAALLEGCVDRGCEGVVVQGFGAGNLSETVYESLKNITTQGVAVVVSTAVHHGGVIPMYSFAGGGQTTKALGAYSAGLLTTNKARIMLMLCLAVDGSKESARTHLAW
ncbi:MAG: asparaginase [Thermoleophilia bacterium]